MWSGTTPRTGAACGEPDGMVAQSRQLRAAARRAAISGQETASSGTRP